MMWLFIILVKAVVVIVGLLTAFAYMTFMERRIMGRMQARIGPNRVGPFGLLQPLADGVKLLFKEDITPARVDLLLYFLAPALSLVVALTAFSVIPMARSIELFGITIDFVIANIPTGLLFFLAIASLGVYGIMLGGYSSGNKYAFLGTVRASAQIVSYELSLGLSVMGVVMLAGTVSLPEIIAAQGKLWFICLQPIGFIVFLIGMFAETNRAPFDLVEAETELVAGFHTEYSSFKFAMFFMAEYVAMITLSAMAATLFLGGWQGPWLPSFIWFALKVAFFLFLFIWVRATLPRFRYDQLMQFGWKVLLPLALLNLFLTGVFILAF